jgi:hypothetical protein
LETATVFSKRNAKIPVLVFSKRNFFMKSQRCSQELAAAADVSVAASQSGEEEREEGSESEEEEELTSLEEMLGQFAPASSPADFTSHALGKASG